MQTTMAVETIPVTLSELLDGLNPGDEITLTRGNSPVAKLIGEGFKARSPRVAGKFKGMITLLHEDDEHLEGFKEYMG